MDPLDDLVNLALTKWLIPSNAVLFVSIVLFVYLLFKANRRSDFSIVDSLRGDDGKASAARIVFYAAFITTTWSVMAYVSDKTSDARTVVEMFVAYTLVWAAPKVLERYIEARYGKRDGDQR